MNIIMFLIFLLSDLIIVLICGFSYGKKHEYREGMLLGVHIPKEALDTGKSAGWYRSIKRHGGFFRDGISLHQSPSASFVLSILSYS